MKLSFALLAILGTTTFASPLPLVAPSSGLVRYGKVAMLATTAAVFTAAGGLSYTGIRDHERRKAKEQEIAEAKMKVAAMRQVDAHLGEDIYAGANATAPVSVTTNSTITPL